MKRFFRAELAGDALAAAMQKLASTDALIVDVRACRGGDPVMVVLPLVALSVPVTPLGGSFGNALALIKALSVSVVSNHG